MWISLYDILILVKGSLLIWLGMYPQTKICMTWWGLPEEGHEYSRHDMHVYMNVGEHMYDIQRKFTSLTMHVYMWIIMDIYLKP